MPTQTAIPAGFVFSNKPEPHKERTKEILRKHPEIRQYLGKNPLSFLYTAGIVALQILMAYWLREQAWWLVVLVAYTVGALANHALFVAHSRMHAPFDFPSVPWNNLPKVRATALEYYDTLVWHQSWTKLLLQFLFDSKLSLFSRTVRAERGQVALNAEVKPDIDAINRMQPSPAA